MGISVGQSNSLTRFRSYLGKHQLLSRWSRRKTTSKVLTRWWRHRSRKVSQNLKVSSFLLKQIQFWKNIILVLSFKNKLLLEYIISWPFIIVFLMFTCWKNVLVLPSNDLHYMSVVVAQLLKESFPILEVCGSNPV